MSATDEQPSLFGEGPGLAERLLAALTGLDQEALVACFDPDARLFLNPGGEPHVGHHGLRVAFHGFAGAYRVVRAQERARLTAGGLLVVSWAASCVPVYDAPEEIAGLFVARLSRTGRIAEAWNHPVGVTIRLDEPPSRVDRI